MDEHLVSQKIDIYLNEGEHPISRDIGNVTTMLRYKVCNVYVYGEKQKKCEYKSISTCV